MYGILKRESYTNLNATRWFFFESLFSWMKNYRLEIFWYPIYFYFTHSIGLRFTQTDSTKINQMMSFSINYTDFLLISIPVTLRFTKYYLQGSRGNSLITVISW